MPKILKIARFGDESYNEVLPYYDFGYHGFYYRVYRVDYEIVVDMVGIWEEDA